MKLSGFKKFDGSFGLRLTEILAAAAIVFTCLAVFEHWAWIFAVLPFSWAAYWRWNRIHSSQPRRFYNHFLHVFTQTLALESNRANAEGDEVSAKRAAAQALQVLRPDLSEVDHMLLFAKGLALLKDDNDRNRLTELVFAQSKSTTLTVAQVRSRLDAQIDQSSRSVEVRWIAAQHIAQLWGDDARHVLLRDLFLGRLSE